MNEAVMQVLSDTKVLDASRITELCNRVLGQYSITAIKNMTGGYGHECFLVVCKEKKFLLKINIRHTKKSDVQNEIYACNILKSIVPVPNIFCDGELKEEKSFYYVQEYVEGNDALQLVGKMSHKEASKFFESFGEAIGRIHSIQGNYYSEDLLGFRKHNSYEDYCNKRLKRSLEACIKYELVSPKQIDIAIKKFERIKSCITSESIPYFNHGDLHLGNLICDDSYHINSIIDFESSKFTDVSFDFVKLNLWILSNHQEYFQDFMNGYRRTKRISDDFEARLDYSFGIEIIHFIDYFGRIYPNKSMYESFLEEILNWVQQ